MALPSDAFILLGVVNTKLRDFYGNLDELCDDLGEDRKGIEEKLGNIGYQYDENRNQFV